MSQRQMNGDANDIKGKFGTTVQEAFVRENDWLLHSATSLLANFHCLSHTRCLGN